MNCHEDNIVTTEDRATATRPPMIVLIGNPNVGKSVLFTKLTANSLVVSNCPGTTTEIAHTQDTQQSRYSLEIPLSPTHGISVWDNTQTVTAPTYLLAPSATLGRWIRVRRLAHDFLVGQYGVITMALSCSLAFVLPIVTTFFLVFRGPHQGQ
jgi:GTPase SAR1 family protein